MQYALAVLPGAHTSTGSSAVWRSVRFHELVLERSGQPHCLQIWRTIEPRVRAHFRRDAPRHRESGEVADEHRELLEALRTREEHETLAPLERHIRNYLAPASESDGGTE